MEGVATITIIHVVQRYRRRKLCGASLPLPPGPVGLPLVGNALHFIGPLGRSPHRVLARLAQTYGPVVSFRPGTAGNFVVVSSPEAAREALVDNDAALAARFVPDTARAMAHSSASLLFLPSSSSLWKQHRLTAGAHLSSVRACSGRPVKVGEVVLGGALNLVSNILFADDVVELRARGGGSFRDLMVAVLEDWTRPNVSDAFPFLAPLDLLGSRRRIAGNLAKLYSFLDEEFIEPRLGSGDNHDDLLDAVLARHAKSEITRPEITSFFTDIFLAASNTSRITVEWAMALLLNHPEKMNKVRAELVAGLQAKDFVEESDLSTGKKFSPKSGTANPYKLPYLHAVVKETLRLRPPAPLLPRKVVDDGVSLRGFAVPKGTYVLINLWAIGRDPRLWHEPEEFKPERFLSTNKALHFRGTDFAYRPFGAGRRVCPGMDLAARFVPLVLASILHKIDWKLPAGGMASKYVDLRDRYSMVLELATPLRAVPAVSTT
ncbi:hypothetical protein ACP70R_019717 [Stipagrostis hirtigluma subsp. patula]